MGWNTPFDESMLSLRNGVVVLCPTKDDFKGMAEILDRNNIRFASGSALDHLNFWDDHKNDTCFYIKNGGCCTAQHIAPKRMSIEDILNAHFAGYHHQTLKLRAIRRCVSSSAFNRRYENGSKHSCPSR